MAEAKGFGLLGEYYNNRWIFGDPVVTRVDAKIDFMWSEADTLTPTGQDYISVRYVGFRRVIRVIPLPLLSGFFSSTSSGASVVRCAIVVAGRPA